MAKLRVARPDGLPGGPREKSNTMQIKKNIFLLATLIFFTFADDNGSFDMQTLECNTHCIDSSSINQLFITKTCEFC